MTLSPLEAIPLDDAVARIDPTYMRTSEDPFGVRINDLCAIRDGRCFVIIGGKWLFVTTDGFATLDEVPEINRVGDHLAHATEQSLDAIVETMDGTILLVGRDCRGRAAEPLGVVWRLPRGGRTFERRQVADPPWLSGRGGNISAGLLGRDRVNAVAFTVYAPGEPHFHLSTDDGESWRRVSAAGLFREHVHEVYLPRAAGPTRPARLWLSGGDDPSGEGSGVICADGVTAEGTLEQVRWALRERPGFRFVSLAGDGKHVFVGNESLAGGVVKIADNVESIEAGDAELVLGKSRHDYHQFRTLLATPDGLLASGSSSYEYTGDTVRADAGGVLYLSTDQGITWAELLLGARWVTTLACHGPDLLAAACAGRDTGPDPSERRLTVLRVARPSPWQPLGPALQVRVLAADSSEFYRLAGYPTHPQPVLAPGEVTWRVDVSNARSLRLLCETRGAGHLRVEALPFATWRLADNPWREVASLALPEAGRYDLTLPEAAYHARWLRLSNVGTSPLPVSLLALVART